MCHFLQILGFFFLLSETANENHLGFCFHPVKSSLRYPTLRIRTNTESMYRYCELYSVWVCGRLIRKFCWQLICVHAWTWSWPRYGKFMLSQKRNWWENSVIFTQKVLDSLGFFSFIIFIICKSTCEILFVFYKISILFSVSKKHDRNSVENFYLTLCKVFSEVQCRYSS